MFQRVDPDDLGKQIYIAKKGEKFYSFLVCKFVRTDIVDSVLIRENGSQWEIPFLHPYATSLTNDRP